MAVFHKKVHISLRNSATKFLYLTVQKWLVGDLAFYMKIWLNWIGLSKV